MRLVVNGREVTNPVARRIAGALVMLAVMLVLTLMALVVLPLIGIAIGVGLGLGAVALGSLLIGVPLARLTTRRTIEPLVPPPDAGALPTETRGLPPSSEERED